MNKTNSNVIYKSLTIIFLTLMAIYTVFPLFVMILGSFKSLGELRQNLFGFPNPPKIAAYAKILNPEQYTLKYVNNNNFNNNIFIYNIYLYLYIYIYIFLLKIDI